ncbi:similar to Saccharomyces cerevisiae YCR020C-A MAK31 Non-catalytic subunit of N-terminal acetyltransferase of the NatC type [Maudiozyma barnettii]|uniref:Similar to Saccharomyces cerevisiae YCR020C-A MAK31 Non-catalytic subunit of N-terminal acetyltransferase of the NatC type n=1 Tax=Maudiozyma barnettii TaxID=61262 RepID=A0A8H2VFU1_9SACH|nr:Mak31p [Kazachstania barnettii]CAB4254680.1 similar to Saccharomyces cerevisiae YCR020C-A MAK31 Non-catalytic subunit of N-terminal acetyltransferase of the NatC type [Kazachstania barnettii]CAD1782722.1 similar to Saccharomyces cerevisiae YCR020C-A MAK31 Non-catalytic subunit of N-terminal acetyltransferase of the NatC type [Kazachstania barnettii]
MDTLTLKDIIGSTLYITVSEVRLLKGTLVAIDAQANLLLDEVEECCPDNVRKLGLVSVPFLTIRDIQIQKSYVNRLEDYKRQLQKNII